MSRFDDREEGGAAVATVASGTGAAPRTSAPRRAQPQRTARTRMQILLAAGNVFGRLGFGATRVEDILTEAGISRPTFYRFFSSKDDVFDALDDHASMSLLELCMAALDSVSDPADKIERGVEAYMRWLGVTGPLAAALIQESSRPDSHLAPRRESTQTMLVSLFSEELEKLRKQKYDRIFLNTLLLSVESVGMQLLRESPRLTEKQIARGKRIAMRILSGALAFGSYEATPMPLEEK